MKFSKWQKSTIAVVLGTTAFLGLYDILTVIATRGNSATISLLISWAASKWPAISFFFGFLMGHFFGQDTNPTLGEKNG